MNRDFLTDLQNGMYLKDDKIASMIPYYLHDTAYALEIDADPELRMYLAAAITAYKHKLPFDTVISEMDIEDFSDENSRDQYEVICGIAIKYAYTTSKIAGNYLQWNFPKAGEKHNTQLILFVSAMQRLQTAFKSAVLLLNHGFFVEVVPIFRLIMEQLAFGCYLMNEDNPEKIKTNQTQSDIKYLKKVLNENKYGILYGYLSKEAHLEPDAMGKYIRVDEERGITAIRDRSGEECKKETITLILFLRAFARVVWEGMNVWGFPETGKEYFDDWFKSQMLMCSKLKDVFDGKTAICRIKNLL